MFKILIQFILIFAGTVSTMAYATNNNPYLPPVFADNNRLSKLAEVFPAIDQMYKEHAAANNFPGYAYGIVVDGKLVYSGAGGYADIDKKTPVTKNTMFRIASMTKSFTAMAIVKLRDAGKLKLDDPVYLYIPELKNQHLTSDTPAITIRDLLIHNAGLPQDDPWADRRLGTSYAELFTLLKKGISFSTVTGTEYEYSNLAYAMLGYIIEKASGVSYQKYIATNIWQPLNMHEAAWEYSLVPAAQLAHGYRWSQGNWQAEELLHDGVFGAMGGMIASIEAFSKYVALQQSAWPARDGADTGPVTRSTLREMQHPWSIKKFDIEPYTKAYGYGLLWSRDAEGKVFTGHSGGLPGFGSNWLIMPEYGVGVIFLANLTYGSTSELNFQVLNKLVKEAQLKPRQLPVSKRLQTVYAALVKLLPAWNNAQTSGLFAENFFIDTPVDELRKTTTDLFAKAGDIIEVGEIVPENQLRGHFIVKGKHASLRVSFTMTPENTPLIQKYKIEELT